MNKTVYVKEVDVCAWSELDSLAHQEKTSTSALLAEAIRSLLAERDRQIRCLYPQQPGHCSTD